MDIRYREARPEDMPACVDLFLESLGDLQRRQNLASDDLPPASRMLAFYQHALSTGIFHVAETDGRIAALACALVRDHLWFLAGFWARPDLQRQHIGMTVLRRVWDAGEQAGAKHFFVWSSSDLPAMAAYMKLGMLPGSQIMVFEGTANFASTVSASYGIAPLRKSFAMALDETVLGTSREADHAFFSRAGWQGREVLEKGKSIGYYYLDGGSIGPAAWIASEYSNALLTLACREASATGSEIALSIPGMNHAALRFALSSGLRLTRYAHLLMSGSFAHLQQYVPSGPALF
jgi:hypothetical protein